MTSFSSLKASNCPALRGRLNLKDNLPLFEAIVQFYTSDSGAEIVVITHEVTQGQMNDSLQAIKDLKEIQGVSSHMGCL